MVKKSISKKSRRGRYGRSQYKIMEKRGKIDTKSEIVGALISIYATTMDGRVKHTILTCF